MSHFSTIKTQLKKPKPLVKALVALGFSPLEGNSLIKGYKGQVVEADIAVKLTDKYQIGFRWNNDNEAYELVADLDLWKYSIPVERFLAKVTQGYALNTLLATTNEEGFKVVEQKNKLDGSIELVVTRWD
tara:strand:+ start:1442 stop:1831 length:390 start_codon:yes stop_codon:yes gene_type:complete